MKAGSHRRQHGDPLSHPQLAEYPADSLPRIGDGQCFSGRKQRRSVVEADASYKPHWGGWDWLVKGPDRRAFTRLRTAINAFISPLEVDHVDFTPLARWGIASSAKV